MNSEEAKRSPESFLQESCIGSISCLQILSSETRNQKNLETTAIKRTIP